MDIETIKIVVDLTKAKVDILRLKADDYTWACHVDADTKAQLEATLMDINSQLAELRKVGAGTTAHQWLCPKCGVDRFKVACPGNVQPCPMIATAQDA